MDLTDTRKTSAELPHTRMRAGAPRVFASAAGSSSPPWHRASRILGVLILSVTLFFGGCFSYSFTGTSIPEGVNTIYIPFFADQSTSGIADLSDQLNRFLVNRFVNQTRLQLANSRGEADAILEGQITSYSNRPFSVTSDEETDQNQVTISVRATYQYTSEDQPEWNQQFSGSSTYDPNENPIEGEQTAAAEALEQVVNNMFNDAVSDW